jgi:predicted RNA methylase
MHSEQIMAWHRENVRKVNAEIRAAGVCVMRSSHPNGPVSAEYVWHTKTIVSVGNELPLCARCCAKWRADAAEDPDLMPARITSLLQ